MPKYIELHRLADAAGLQARLGIGSTPRFVSIGVPHVAARDRMVEMTMEGTGGAPDDVFLRARLLARGAADLDAALDVGHRVQLELLDRSRLREVPRPRD